MSTSTPPTGPVLLALLNSPVPTQRERGEKIVRRALRSTLSTVEAAALLKINARTIQRLLKKRPALCQGLAVRGRGRPPKTIDDTPNNKDTNR